MNLEEILNSRFPRPVALTLLGLGVAASVLLLPRLEYSFNFEQFFPKGDPDYEYFREFIAEFETDDNFLLLALDHEPSVFDTVFMQRADRLADELRTLPYIKRVISPTEIVLPVRNGLSFTGRPLLHKKSQPLLRSDSILLMRDERFAGKVVSRDGKSLLLYMKTEDGLSLDQAQELIPPLLEKLENWEKSDYHLLGRANFQVNMVKMQRLEILRSSAISGLLVTIVFFLIYRNIYVMGFALVAIGLSFLLFMGMLSGLGRELNAMSGLYPVIMIIVGSSDVIHMLSKYVSEVNNGRDRRRAIVNMVREIGLATFLTSVTTAIGFLSLMTSKIGPVKEFGINSALGVLLAFFVVILFSIAVLPVLPVRWLRKSVSAFRWWDRRMLAAYHSGKRRRIAIILVTSAVMLLAGFGISQVSTDYRIEESMPRGAKVTEDFLFFNDRFFGFRPLEVAVDAKGGDAGSYRVIRQVDSLQQYLASYKAIDGLQSMAGLYRGINQAFYGNDPEYFRFPRDSAQFALYRNFVDRFKDLNPDVLLSKDGDKTRISGNIKDIGADSISAIIGATDRWIAANLDTGSIGWRQTGTGIIVDKNAVYVRQDLLAGLGLAIGIVSILMGFLYRNWRMLIIALIPNLLPLLIAAAALGYFGIELEAGISITFAVVFGIAVDDTIHFLSKFRLVQSRNHDIEFCLKQTFVETGKAICLTTLVLFFGFLTLLASIHPPSQVVGMLISVTLVSAVLADLYLIPILIRKLL